MLTQESRHTLIWITDLLKRLNIPFQIAGGLAAIIYGATRPLNDIDIDIPEDQFDLVVDALKEFIIFGPQQFKDENWDLLLMTLNYQRQSIDISGAHHTKIFNQATSTWQAITTDFSNVVVKNINGLLLPVIPWKELVSYKKILGREADLLDLVELTGQH